MCLHASTSGLDLPMKVVDMFGAGAPVAALAFPCVAELIRDGVNGTLFEDAAGLARALASLLADAGAASRLATLRDGVAVAERWDAMWDRCVKPTVAPAFAA